MANKKLTNNSTEKKGDSTKSLRLVVGGIAIGAYLLYVINGGFYEHTLEANIGILLFVGIAYGMWVEHWLSKHFNQK